MTGTADSLAVWLRVRREADWHGAPALLPRPSAPPGPSRPPESSAAPGPYRQPQSSPTRPSAPYGQPEPSSPPQPSRQPESSAPPRPSAPPGSSPLDGFRAWCAGPVRRRDPVRSERLLRAHGLCLADARRRAPLGFALLAGWQCEVLGVPRAPFRTGDAHAKGGRERYGLTARTREDFAACLREAADPDLPLAGRAARAYLDVAFFHPFDDGNARAALLTLVHVLAREDVVLPEVGPLQTTRYADDPEGAADLATLIGVLHRRGGTPAPAHR
ncbi:hypothetical protein [Streptomyces aureus]|uniref:hypothetical protein n=1 Tax=Streptomyces aureus TaxID=193461 RepID=UPI0036910C10